MREPSRVGLGIARSRESSRRRAWFASALSIVYMGLGQLYNGELAKGFLFALYHTVILTFAVPRLLRALEGLVTLGTMEGKDNSVFLLAQGLLGVIVGGSLLVFYVLGAVDAFVVARNKAAYQATRSSRAPARTFRAAASPYICLLPALILVALTVVFPLLFGMSLAFTSYDLYNSPPARLFQWVGLLNFKEIFQIKSWRGTFASVLNWTVVWAILSTFTCFAFGLLLAILLNNPKLRFRAVIRTILILPWAIPGFISTLMWGGLLNTSFGPVNLFLQRLGLQAIPWFQEVFWSRVALVLVNLWLGFPFAMTFCTGLLQSIPEELYDAAEVDGATPWTRFAYITLPMILYAAAPILVMQFAGNFNSFGLIYLLTGGGPPVFGRRGAGGTDILISWIFKMTFDLFKYNYAAAVSVLIYIPIAIISIFNLRSTRAFREEGMMG